MIILAAVILAQVLIIIFLIRKKEPKTSLTLTEPQSLNILHRAYKKAQAILGEAEIDSVKIHAQSEIEVKKANEKLVEALSKEGREELKRYLTEFEKGASEATMKSLEEYKTGRMKALDENITAVVEATVEKVLGKKLSLTDQTDLVYEALEKAKQEKLIQ